MNKLFSIAGIFTLLMSVTLFSWAEGSCRPIAMVCMKMGYYKGGEKEGKGLIKDCILPVVSGSRTLPNTNFTQEQLQQCKMKIAEKMKSKMQ